MIEPPVCVPSAARHMPHATAAAEPLDEPPGVRSRFQGLRVTGGIDPGERRRDRLAQDDRACLAEASDDGRIDRSGVPLPAVDPAGGGQALHVDDVLDPDRNPVQRAAVASGLQLGVEGTAPAPMHRRDPHSTQARTSALSVDPVETF